MPDHPLRGADLRTPAPTLEPDDVFLARLSSLAAAGADVPWGAPAPLATWRVGLAAASVAAVLVGVAWLGGLDPSGSPNPAPATTPTAPVETPTAAGRTPGPGRGTDPVGASVPAFGATPPATQADPADRAGRPDRGAAEQVDPVNGNGNGESQGAGTGPDEHAGDHPNKHATTKSNRGRPHIGSQAGRGVGGRPDR